MIMYDCNSIGRRFNKGSNTWSVFNLKEKKSFGFFLFSHGKTVLGKWAPFCVGYCLMGYCLMCLYTQAMKLFCIFFFVRFMKQSLWKFYRRYIFRLAVGLICLNHNAQIDTETNLLLETESWNRRILSFFKGDRISN